VSQAGPQLQTPGGWGASQILDSLDTIGRAGREQPAPGSDQPAPDFSLKSFSGPVVSLAQLRGRPLVVNFFASWCGPCRSELPLLQQRAAAHPEFTFVLIDVVDQQGAAQDLLNRLQVRTPLVLSDPDGSASTAYGATGLPTTVFLRADGSVAARVARQLDAATISSRMSLAVGG